MSAKLSSTEVETKLAALSGWEKSDDTIHKLYKFKNFTEAIAFVNKLVEPAEAAGHHPDLNISYNKVTINLTTHDAEGLTQKDFDLAATFDQL
ncbi:MAG: 4a-hydroxytetrahydrobiopterin dehydratase [Limnothrix sp. RL_2_0]|nr:4a-hydroxytetrahydrobiopterin dehydratase [Limnothrix sp. RL_2_0]